MKIFGPGFSHLTARAGKLGRVLGIWDGTDGNRQGRVWGTARLFYNFLKNQCFIRLNVFETLGKDLR